MVNKIENIIIDSLNGLQKELENEELTNYTTKTKLYGKNGILDSLDLVSLITDLEEVISDEFGKDIVLADEKAMSQKNSPFNTVNTLSVYIEQLLR